MEKKERRSQTKNKMFISYILIPLLILSVITGVFVVSFYHTSRKRILTFENRTAVNIDEQLKTAMDNLIQSASQYSMTPWVERLKYMQKVPGMMKNKVTASDISDYASNLMLTEINDRIIDSVFIYFSIGEFGISSSGKVNWNAYVRLNQIDSDDEDFRSGCFLSENNQKKIYHNVSMVKNGKNVQGFFLVQTIPLQNFYSGEVNIMFFVPYANICDYIKKFADEGTSEFYLTDGEKIVYTETEKEASFFTDGAQITDYRSEDKEFHWNTEFRTYMAEYTKGGMDIGVVQILSNAFVKRDFLAMLRWIAVCYVFLCALILVVSFRMTNHNYQPLEHIMDMLEEDTSGNLNEYQMIENALKELDDQKQRLEVTVYEQNPLIEQYILHSLLNSDRIQIAEQKYVNTMRQHSTFRCLILRDGKEAKQLSGEVDACLAVYPQVHTAFLKEDLYFVWILSYGEEEILEEVLEFLEQTIGELSYTDIAMAVSNVYESILDAPIAYREAILSTEYHFFFPQKKIIRYLDDSIQIREECREELSMPDAMIQKMDASMQTFDVEELLNICTVFLNGVISGGQYSQKALFQVLRKLNGYITEWFRKNGGNSLIEQMDLLEPENFINIDEYLQALQNRVLNLIDCCKVRENPLYASMNQTIRQYVEEHLTDANLSLNETARVMHYTATYFGKYFREQFGCAFQQYVAIRRIECAKDYLHNYPDRKTMSIQEIALKCGFTNDVTFRRTFKRYTGMTPSQYEREQIGTELSKNKYF